MTQVRRRLFLVLLSLLLVVLASSGPGFRRPPAALAANGDANASFDPLSNVNPPSAADTLDPPRLYAGDISHVLPANAVTANGYCLTLHTQNLVPEVSVAIPKENLGFSVVATDPINPSNPATPATLAVTLPGVLRADLTKPWLTSVDAPAGYPGTPTANGDKFCVIVRSPAGYLTLDVSWSYRDASNALHRISLNDPDFVPIVTVTLAGGSVGPFGTVCTVGWDGSFLTGTTSNQEQDLLTNTPDPVDDVRPPDWVPFDFTGPVTVASVQRDQADSTQWCVTLMSTTGAPADTNVRFSFAAEYNRVTNLDDQPHQVSLTQRLHIIGSFSLAHIGPSGEVLAEQNSPQLVAGSRAAVCILGTNSSATMTLGDVNIWNASGQDQAITSGLELFRATAVAPFHEFNPNVPAGTLCFSYSSGTPGEQMITANFMNAGVPQHAQWVAVTEAGSTQIKTGALVVQWNRIDSTALTTGGDPEGGTVTYTTVLTPLTFFVPTDPAARGVFGANINVVEWVKGSHRSNGSTVGGYLNGVVIHATITDPSGQCGHFDLPSPVPAVNNGFAKSVAVPAAAGPRDIWGASIGGRFSFGRDTVPRVDDLPVSIEGDSCSPTSSLRVRVDVFYPGQSVAAKPAEYVDFQFTFQRPTKTPHMAWAGQVISITYGFSGCPATDLPVTLTRAANQRGTFIASPGLTVTASSARGTINASNCSVTALFTSADPGEADIQAVIDNNPYSKMDYPLYFVAIEDVTLTATTTATVSATGSVSASVRSWFVGSNPSGREAETKPDGRRLPADRWIFPDDAGSFTSVIDDRAALEFTFLMEDETVVNSYPGGVKNGALGWFLPASYDQATPDFTPQPDGKGQYPRPRMVTVIGSADGASVATFGDYNLSFEGCARNAATGSPHCKQGDVVGHTRYWAVADYTASRGKQSPVASNDGTTEWTWGGFKEVTVINGDDPTHKFVVAHLLDRDGYCDSQGWNNTLGIPVRFEIDSGSGAILQAWGEPAVISKDRRTATAFTFNTAATGLLGEYVYEATTKPTVADGECQAWIEVSNSLLDPVNVIVTFPPQPAPVPADVRITRLVCSQADDQPETFTLTNRGTTAVSLAGYALRSMPGSLASDEQHVELRGVLGPGASVTFHAGPGAPQAGWISGDLLLNDDPNDYLRLVWDNFELSRATCNGVILSPPVPNPLPPDGEGTIVLDKVLPFGQEKTVVLDPGWNLVVAGEASTDLATALAGFEKDVVGVYLWDAATSTWKHYAPGVPGSDATALAKMEKRQAYWVLVKRSFTLTLLK